MISLFSLLKKNMTIKNIRDNIDKVDEAIAALLKKRWGLVADISALKKLAPEEAGYRPFREHEIYNKLPDDAVVARDDYWTIWKEIMTTTVMRENPFHIAINQDFFTQHGFMLAQEFGRHSKWKIDGAPLDLLASRKVGLAVVGIDAVDDVLSKGDKIAIVNIFPSFIFHGKEKITQRDILGLIISWKKIENITDDRNALAVVVADDRKKIEIVSPNKTNGRPPLAMVPRPPHWKD